MFNDELKFEEALISYLTQNAGWSKNVLKFKNEEQLIQNWAKILFDNNRDIDRLNDYPLTKGEMDQILDQVSLLRTPIKLNGFINGKTISIKRDNPEDKLHFGKEVSLKIFNRAEIAGGQSVYQIAEQPIFSKKSAIMPDRRGDFMLLINGMPVIHVELKKSGIPVSQAVHQIEKYSHEGVFTGLFSLVQVFVTMTPEETLYFANPGPDGKFNSLYYFHWADVNNEPINDWQKIASYLLSIPMAHQLIGFYTVPDNTDGVLKVLRSYQYYAANAISDKVSKTLWGTSSIYGGYVWHTTGSGKTLTSFKSAQLIANSKDADKVIFLMDRIELGTQSLADYRGFADESDDVQGTENTSVLLSKLKSDDPSNTLIVTSIQKMKNIKEDGIFNDKDIAKINAKRLVFIIDECHRSTFGEMLTTIKHTFPNALYFGFTGTPIFPENEKYGNYTATIFGSELHRYSIADGIRDGNVLGFDPVLVPTFSEKTLRKVVGLSEAKAKTEQEAFSNPTKKAIYLQYLTKVPMAGSKDEQGNFVPGIEDFVPDSQYYVDSASDPHEHEKAVVKHMLSGWITLSQDKKFSALLATSSINEAISYYRLFKQMDEKVGLNISAIFDPQIDENNGALYKEDGLIEIINDYNAKFHKHFSLSDAGLFKKDVCMRLAHKYSYAGIEKSHDDRLDLVIVVNQLLTGYDSKWINTLYLDKMLREEHIIQAFSRTNRLFGPDKPYGTIMMYRRPFTMKRDMEKALNDYSGNRPFGVFVDKLEKNLNSINADFDVIKEIFEADGISDFRVLPKSDEARAKFAKCFKSLNYHYNAAKIQGFVWPVPVYSFQHDDGKDTQIKMHLDQQTYDVLLQRYKELLPIRPKPLEDAPFDIATEIMEIDTTLVDANYMESRFKKYIKSLNGGDPKVQEEALNELHRTFTVLSQEEQKFANLLLHDIQNGSLKVQADKTISDYIHDYIAKAKDNQISKFAASFGVDEQALRLFLKEANRQNLNAFGNYDKLKETINRVMAKKFFHDYYGEDYSGAKLIIEIDNYLTSFVTQGGFDIEEKKK
jgi:type I restriction enzyme R subunit